MRYSFLSFKILTTIREAAEPNYSELVPAGRSDGRAPGWDFDVQFWQALGPGRILEAGWDLVVTVAPAKGIHQDRLRSQRSVEHFQRGGRAIPDRRRIRRGDPHGAALHESKSAETSAASPCLKKG
jgi:hypothetical protein